MSSLSQSCASVGLDKGGRLLLVECSLILEPSAVSGHALDLFAVEIGDWVARARVCRVGAVPLDTCKELALLLHHLGLEAPVDDVKHLVAQRRPNQPAQAGAGHGHDAQGEEGIERDLRNERLGKALG